MLSDIRVLQCGESLSSRLTGYLMASLGAVVLSDDSKYLDARDEWSWLEEGCSKFDRGEALSNSFGADDSLADVVITDSEALSVEPMKDVGTITCFLSGEPAKNDNESAAATEIKNAAGSGVFWSGREGGISEPSFTAIPFVSVFGALNAAIGIVGALLMRDRFGSAEDVFVSLDDTIFSGFGCLAISVNGVGGVASGSSDRWGKGRYTCKDGRWIQLCTGNEKFATWLSEAVGKRDEWSGAGYLSHKVLASDREIRQEWLDVLAEEFKKRDAAEWESLDSRIPITLVRTRGEWNTSDLAAGAGVFRSEKKLDLAPLAQVMAHSVEKCGTGDGATPYEPAETFATGEYASEVHHLPLDGVNVMDLGTVLATPVAGRVLAEYGASVTKVVHPDRPPVGWRYNLDVNRGKSVFPIDLYQAGALDSLYCQSRVDVTLHNFSYETGQSMGIDAEGVFSLSPGSIFAEVSAFGGGAETVSARGYEINAQAAAGLLRFDEAGVPTAQPLLGNDYGTGLATALGIMAALRSGSGEVRGKSVRTSLAKTASLLTWCAFGEVSPDSKHLETFSGETASLVQIFDSWLCVIGCTDDMTNAASLSSLVQQAGCTTVDEAMVFLENNRKLSVVRVRPLEMATRIAAADPARNGVVVAEASDGSMALLSGPGVRFSRTEVRELAP